MNDPLIEKTILESVSLDAFAPPTGVKEKTVESYLESGLLSDEKQLIEWSTKVLLLKDRREIDRSRFEIKDDIEKTFDVKKRPITNFRVNQRRWCLMSVPTADSVRPEHISYIDYARLYYEACSRDWRAVEQAQEILVEKLTNKQDLAITIPAPPGMDESWGSSLIMQIVGQIPVNSVAQRNMPGSEVFCAPNQGTLNGVLAVPYPVYFKERLLPNLRLVFQNGRVVEWYSDASELDKEFIAKKLATDEGADAVGEIGIGTNPAITEPVPDSLLAEKSFGIHLALGKAYDYTEYLGKKVNVDNGNRSAIHIDIPRIMTPKYGGGTIIVDGEIIFENGKFIDSRLSCLNPPSLLHNPHIT